MNSLAFITIMALSSSCGAISQIFLLDQLNFIASQSRYATETYSQLKAPFSMESVMMTSLEAAMQTCRSSFKWERWNCPSSDFLLRSSSNSLLLDREDTYIKAITTAAVLYTITKNCSSGIIAECDVCSDRQYGSYCSDDPEAAEKLFEKHISTNFSENFFGKVAKHNYKAVTNLLKKSLIEQTACAVTFPNGVCSKEISLKLLKSFEDIAAGIRQMYREGILIRNAPKNSRILWDNIPLDALVYMTDSPNYCEPDAVPHWNGMQGRQCSAGAHGTKLTKKERKRCRYLCRECGYTVQPKNVITETSCNCKLTWTFQVRCDKCITVQRQYYCY